MPDVEVLEKCSFQIVGIKYVMKQNSNRRSRSRGQHKKTHGKNSYDSNGPAGRVRGTAQQVLEKYQVLVKFQ